MARGSGKRSSRPCSVCRRWFVPDPRVRNRQRTCGSAECRRALKRRTQARWSEAHPDYWAARRLSERLSEVREGPRPLRGPPAGVRQIPADIVQDEIGPQVLVILLFLARLQHRAAQDEIRRQVMSITREIRRLLKGVPQDETAVEGEG
jgi:hypothetical protein